MKNGAIRDLTLEGHNLSEADLETVFNTGSMFGVDEIPLGQIIERLEKTYCGTLASEYMYIENLVQKRWVQEQLETSLSTPDFREGRKNRILELFLDPSFLHQISNINTRLWARLASELHCFLYLTRC